VSEIKPLTARPLELEPELGELPVFAAGFSQPAKTDDATLARTIMLTERMIEDDFPGHRVTLDDYLCW
jgi:hypothetical protein